MFDLEKLNKISTPDSTWKKESAYIQENRAWLHESAKIALIVLRALKDKSISQKDLAGIMGIKVQQVSRIVKGKENLTLQTICKLEQALRINIIQVNTQFKAESAIIN